MPRRIPNVCFDLNVHIANKVIVIIIVKQKILFKFNFLLLVCPDGYYGIDCLQVCHCFNDEVCDKVLGFCPNNKCHPDWVGAGCSKSK